MYTFIIKFMPNLMKTALLMFLILSHWQLQIITLNESGKLYRPILIQNSEIRQKFISLPHYFNMLLFLSFLSKTAVKYEIFSLPLCDHLLKLRVVLEFALSSFSEHKARLLWFHCSNILTFTSGDRLQRPWSDVNTISGNYLTTFIIYTSEKTCDLIAGYVNVLACVSPQISYFILSFHPIIFKLIIAINAQLRKCLHKKYLYVVISVITLFTWLLPLNLHLNNTMKPDPNLTISHFDCISSNSILQCNVNCI